MNTENTTAAGTPASSGLGSRAGTPASSGLSSRAETLASSDLSFRIGPIRPPSEANSLLLQVTRGCTWNRCRFCTIYRDTSFKAFSADSVKRDIDAIAAIAEKVREFRRPVGRTAGGQGDAGSKDISTNNGTGSGSDPSASLGGTGSGSSTAAASDGPAAWDLDGLNDHLSHLHGRERESFYLVANWLIRGGESVFLQDGNTTALAGGKLSDVLIYLREAFPNIRRITSYGRAAELARHDASYYAELKAAGLDRIHCGFESGSDRVLNLIRKGTTSEQEITAGRNVRSGGIELSIYFMPGIGGRELSLENGEETARVIRAVEPDFVRVRTAAVKAGTELFAMLANGEFRLCSEDEKVREIRTIIDRSEGLCTRLVSDHMVNLLQNVEGSLREDRKKMLSIIDDYLALPEADRRAFQLLRRSLQAYEPADIRKTPPEHLEELRAHVSGYSEDDWDAEMNELIGRYI